MSASLGIDLTLQQASVFHGEIFNTDINLYVRITVYNIIIVDSKLINPRHRKTGVLRLRISFIKPILGRELSFKVMWACISFLSAEHVNYCGYTVEITAIFHMSWFSDVGFQHQGIVR